MSPPADVLKAYGFTALRIEVVSGGLINETYCVSSEGDKGTALAALQRLHPVFDATVNLDIEALTNHIAMRGVATPMLLRTEEGDAFVEHQGHVWRATTWLEGICHSRVSEPRIAEAGAGLVARFHRALNNYNYDFLFSRPGVHDTEAHLRKLANAQSAHGDALHAEAVLLRDKIAAHEKELPVMPELPLRICHGDLKISNLLFDESGVGLCLIDLDTMGKQTIAYELGDALRSWGNPSGEDTATPAIDEAIVAAAGRGYSDAARGLLSDVEVRSVVTGLETICLELAARFCLDAFEDCYFGWDDKRYASRRAHNLERARGQLALCHSVTEKRDRLQALWTRDF